MIKKIKFLRKLLAPQVVVLVGVMVVAILSGRAAYNDFQTNATVLVRIEDLERNFNLLPSGNIQSMTVNAGNIQLSMAANSKIELVSANLNKFSLSGQTATISEVTFGCEVDQSSIKVVFGTSDATQTLTITPSAEKCSATSPSTPSVGGGGGGGGGGAAAAAPAAAPTAAPVLPSVPGEALAAAPVPIVVPGAPVTAPSIVADVAKLVEALGVTRNVTLETKSASQVFQDSKEFKVTLPETDHKVLANFVTYGVSDATKKLGSGERRALVRDQLETLGRVSLNAFEQLANGQKPTDRNLTKEVAQLKKVLPTFKKLVGRNPDFKNPNDDLAWNTMLYRVRFERNLTKERAGINKFRSSFGRLPKSPLDWASVRAWGYALAK